MATSVAFAADGGIAPALAVAERLMAESPAHRLWLFCAHRGNDSDELERLLSLKDRYLDRLGLGVVTQREADEAELFSGTLDSEKIRALSSRLVDTGSVESYFVFGPDALARDARAALTALGVDGARIHAEESAVAGGASVTLEQSPTADGPHLAPSTPAAQRETQVSFVMDGRRRSFPMRTGDESILDAAARAGIELPFSCKAGVCATCRTKLVRGEVEMAENYALEDWELEQGFILACQSHAKTPEIELTYDEK
jgi:ring-1,2-phenylacetyl-CoA epoxidase subunit PaaE